MCFIHIHIRFQFTFTKILKATVKCAAIFSGFTFLLLFLGIKSSHVASFVTLFDDLTLIAICLYKDKAPKELKFHFLAYCGAPHITRWNMCICICVCVWDKDTLTLKMFLKEIAYPHQGCIYLIKNTVLIIKHQIIILDWFLKDHVTLKTWIMAAEKSALPSKE